MTSRAHISLKTKLASALLVVGQIPHDEAKMLTADQVLSLFHWDHYPIPKAHGGSDEPHNLVPRYIGAHREKTAKVDVPMLAKVDRLAVARQVLQRTLEKPCGQKRQTTGRWPQGRKIRSRGFERRGTR